MKKSYQLIYFSLVSIFIFVLSLTILPYYDLGDQYLYNYLYQKLGNMGFKEGYSFTYRTITTREPVFYTLYWLASKLLTKNLFISFANFGLCFLFLKLLVKRGASPHIAVLTVLSNYYIFVLYFSAEKLKFGFIFLLLSLIFLGSKKFLIFSGMSILSHTQSLIMYLCMLTNYMTKEIKKVIETRKISPFLLVSIASMVLISLAMSNHIIQKVNAYMQLADTFNLMNSVRLVAFLTLSYFYTNKKYELLYLFTPLIFISLIIGGDRINIYGYFIFLYYAVKVNRGFNIGVMITSIYFGYKTIPYVEKIIEYGYGFHK